MKYRPPTLVFFVLAFCLSVLSGCKKDNTINHNYHPVVDAGASQTITLPVDSVRVTGSATDSGSRIVSYLWSKVSGPNVPVIGSEGSKSTIVHGLIQGSYIFQLMAVDSLGKTGVDTLIITVNPHILKTDTLTLGAGSYEMTYLSNNSNYPNGFWGATEFLAESWTIGTGVTGRSYFKFNLSGVPTNTPVVSAKLSLYSDPAPINGNLTDANFGTTNDFFIQRVSANWDSTTLWVAQPAWDTVGRVHIPQTSQSVLDLVNTDVTAMVNKMIASGNYGFLIYLNNEVTYNSRIFCSGTHAIAAKHPRLIITY
jgi:hypothetical protein